MKAFRQFHTQLFQGSLFHNFLHPLIQFNIAVESNSKGMFTRSVFQPIILALLTQRFPVSIGSATHSVYFSQTEC